MAGLLDWITGAVKQQYAQGAPYREAIGGLLKGDPTKFGLLAQEFNRKAQTPEGALDVALNFAPLGVTKIVSPKTQYEIAQDVAQRNATLPVSEGGLGLPANNTAMDRANAMGFDTDVYHATNQENIKSLNTGQGTLGNAVYTAKSPKGIDFFAKLQNMKLEKMGKEPNPISIYPLKARIENTLDFGSDLPFNKIDSDYLITKGYDSASYTRPNLSEIAIFNPSNIRSVNAAFDPFRRNEADILAGLLAVPATQLMKPEEKKKKRNTK